MEKSTRAVSKARVACGGGLQPVRPQCRSPQPKHADHVRLPPCVRDAFGAFAQRGVCASSSHTVRHSLHTAPCGAGDSTTQGEAGDSEDKAGGTNSGANLRAVACAVQLRLPHACWTASPIARAVPGRPSSRAS